MVIKLVFWIVLAATFLGATIFFVTGHNWVPAAICALGMSGSMLGLVEDINREPPGA